MTYNGNANTAGTASMDPESPYNFGPTVTVLGNTGALTKTGYTFAGWNTAANGSGTAYQPTATPSPWARPRSPSTRSGRRCPPSPSPSTATARPADQWPTRSPTSPTALSANAFTRTGYTFTGWNTAANGSGTAYANGATYPFTASTTLYAQWTALPTFTVTFNGNGSTGGSMANRGRQLAHGAERQRLHAHRLHLHRLEHRRQRLGHAYANGATYPFTASTTLYAQWTATGTITTVQSGDAGTSAVASGAAMTVLPANATVGDTVVVAVLGAGSTGQTVTSLTSPMGTFTKVTGNLQSGQSDVELWICSNVTTPARTITVTWSGAGLGFAQATEFSGSLSAVASTPTQGTGTSPTGSVTTTAPGGVALVYVNTQNITAAPSSPWVNYDAGAFVYSWGESVATQTVAAPSTVSASWTLASSVKWQTIGLSLAGSGGTTFTVTFNGNGSTGGSMANQVASSPTALSANAFTRTGYTFTGWNTAANASGTPYANGATYPFTASTTLYAQWTINSYAVTYNGNTNTAGTAPVDPSSPYNFGATVTVLGNTGALTKTGYTFTGWNTAANGSGTAYQPTNTFTLGAAAVTLYAQWTALPTFTVTFNGNGSTGGSMANQVASSPTALSANAFTRTGYTFTGWNTAANASGTPYANGATYPFTASTTLYAQWTALPTFTVTFNGNGSTGGSMANQVASSPTALSANAFTRTGYTFTGWNTAANASGTPYANGATYPFTASTTLYAQWTATGTITTVQSGDAGTSAVASGAAMTVLPANATVGDTVVVAVLGAGSTGQTVTSLTSPMGTFTKVTGNLQSGQSDVELWICSNVTTPARTITVTWSGAGLGFAQATEFSGSLSAVASTPTQGTGTSPTGSVTTTAPGGVALVYVNTQNITAAPSSPWVNYDAGAFVYSWGESVATQTVAAPSTVSASWTLASSVKWQTIGLSLAGH